MRSRRRRQIRQDGRARRTRFLKSNLTKGPRKSKKSSSNPKSSKVPGDHKSVPKSSKVPGESPTENAPPIRGESAGGAIENNSLAVVGAGVITLALMAL